MRLYYAAASPYARKCLVVAHEVGLADQVNVMTAAVNPLSRNEEVAGQNPLAKVPTLVLEDGTALYDSRVIVEHLDGLHGGARVTPPEGPARTRALTQQALGDGLLDAALLIRYEVTVRPEALRWPEWIAGQFAKIDAALDAMEAAAPGLEALDVGAITFACALGYLDFRFADRPWREGRPALAAWFEGVKDRPSFAATAPK